MSLCQHRVTLIWWLDILSDIDMYGVYRIFKSLARGEKVAIENGCTTAAPSSSWLPAQSCSLPSSSSGNRSTVTCEERNFPETW